MTEQESSVQQPSKAPGRFTTSMAVLKQPVPFPSELKTPQQPKRHDPWKLLVGLLVLSIVIVGTLAILPH